MNRLRKVILPSLEKYRLFQQTKQIETQENHLYGTSLRTYLFTYTPKTPQRSTVGQGL